MLKNYELEDKVFKSKERKNTLKKVNRYLEVCTTIASITKMCIIGLPGEKEKYRGSGKCLK